MVKSLSFKVPFPVGKIGESPFVTVLPPPCEGEPVSPEFAELAEAVEAVNPADENPVANQEEEIDLENIILQKARELVASEMELPIQAAQNVLNALQEKFDKEIHDLQHSALKLAYAIAKKIVHREIAETPALVMEQIQAALKQCSEKQVQALLLHPDDHVFLQENLDLLRWVESNFPRMKIEVDEGISRGGCKLELESGAIDATIEAQLAQIENELL